MLRGRMGGGCKSKTFGETKKAGEPKPTQSLYHCVTHIKARHAPNKKTTTRPITGFFLTTAKNELNRTRRPWSKWTAEASI